MSSPSASVPTTPIDPPMAQSTDSLHNNQQSTVPIDPSVNSSNLMNDSFAIQKDSFDTSCKPIPFIRGLDSTSTPISDPKLTPIVVESNAHKTDSPKGMTKIQTQ
jgi:hypothetical protein